jgi:hypothetical protein
VIRPPHLRGSTRARRTTQVSRLRPRS